ncbi:Uncharacterised protein [Canicola haemoglobinophilus]|uniref:DNA helicase UvrD n=1 Tax=Canicola haemoglobinophilus TaxID=733 RepID=A0AB38H965_9PAST|nr:hypothetical protein [Canicola haemoglobinophilus]STO54376.1 Uncharacterised protein [Canicola haemoglobinophilus]STO68910.1 Uncharacterised protein [Canicola haemoglobinophilus]
MEKLKNYFYHVFVGLDQFLNAVAGGAADETFSSRCYRGAVLAKQPKKRWRFWFHFVNGLFFDKKHCEMAYESEVKRRQYPPEFSKVEG